MENGFIILGIIALLFLSMYGYSYLSVTQEKRKAKKEQKRQLQKDAQRREKRLAHQVVIDEKVRKFNERKEEIQRELVLLKKKKETKKVG